jgi:3-(3-hydroxy-phenyl)propionate hydroxylase
MPSYTPPTYSYRPAPGPHPARHRVIVVGGGPVGLAAAIDLALQGVPVLLLDEDDTVSTGSRAICWAKRTLEIFDRLGAAAPMLAKGVTWSRGKLYRGGRQLYEFDLLPEGGHCFPAFINLQQYYAEQYLVERALELGNLLELRWRHRVADLEPRGDGVAVTIETPEGAYAAECDYLVAADGARSTVRRLMGLEFKGKVFEDRFLIADVRMAADFPAERRFWFDPPFHPGRSALLHKQPDNVWRIDLQLGWNADPEAERRPERVLPRLRAMLGPDREFELEWVSVYTFQCRRLDRFRHGRVFFVGDAAHQVSPFGARGGNSGVQDAENLAWKLALVLAGRAPDALLDSYDSERVFAADENISHSTRSTDFISPKGAMTVAFRDAVLDLARHHPFARALVNSGRLSRPTVLAESPLGTPDADEFAGAMAPGAACADSPLGGGDWLLRRLRGGFTGLHFGDTPPPAAAALADGPVPVRTLSVGPAPPVLAERYDARPGTYYLIRPDQHVAGRWRRFDPAAVAAALRRALGAEAGA